MNFFVCVDVLANEKTSASDKSYKQVFDYIRNVIDERNALID